MKTSKRYDYIITSFTSLTLAVGPDVILFPQDAMGALAARAQLHNSKGTAKNSGRNLRLGLLNKALAHRHANSCRFEVGVEKKSSVQLFDST